MVGVGQEAIAAVEQRPVAAGHLDVVDVALGVGEEVVVAEGAGWVGRYPDRPSIVGWAMARRYWNSFGTPGRASLA